MYLTNTMYSQKYDINKTIAFSGHRANKYDIYKGKDLTKISLKLLNVLSEQVLEGYKSFIFGGAPGYDILGARAVIYLKKVDKDIKLICVLPFRNFSKSKYFSEYWEKQYNNVIQHCDDIFIIGKDNYSKGCFNERNKFLINHCKTLVCLYSGIAGGTKNTIDMAKQKGIEIINLLEI